MNADTSRFGNDVSVSIVTPTMNSASTLKRCLDSVSCQKAAKEHLIVDGGSEDETCEIALRYPHVTRVISEPDEGLFDAMNKGIRLSRGAWIGILNSDDYYTEDALGQVLGYAQTYPKSQLLIGDLERFDSNSSNSRYISAKSFASNPSILYPRNHPACFVRREVYNEIGCFDLKYPVSADTDLLLRAASKNYEFRHIPVLLSRMQTGGASHQNPIRAIRDLISIQFKYASVTKASLLVMRFLLQFSFRVAGSYGVHHLRKPAAK